MFSFEDEQVKINQLPCYLTYTNEETHKVIRANLHRSPFGSRNYEYFSEDRVLTGVMAFGEDGIYFNMELFRVYQGSPIGTIGIILILSVLTILLCFIPVITA